MSINENSLPTQCKFILTGPLEGKTISLGSNHQYNFVHGELEIVTTQAEMMLYARFLERNWQAYPEGHPIFGDGNGKRNISPKKSEGKQPSVPSNIQSEGEGIKASFNPNDSDGTDTSSSGTAGSVSEGHRQSESLVKELDKKLLRAVKSLQAGVDEHWTRDGKPMISAIARAYGSTDVTRASIEAVAPGYTRETALKIQSDIPKEST